MTAATDGRTAVRLERTIPAPPHRVYQAWLDPDLLSKWMAPGQFRVTRADVEPRPGGHYRIWQADDGGNAGGFECELLELVPDQRIVFRWGFAGPDRSNGPVYDSRLTITLAGTPDGATALTLVHERLGELAAAMPAVAEQVGAGWADVLGKLAAVLG